MVGEVIDSQGAPALAGKTQRHEYGIDAGASYVIAPGLVGWAEYIYQVRKQSGYNFATGASGSAAGAGSYNQVQGQGIQIGTTVYW